MRLIPSLGKAMRRRDFITLVGGAATGWPLAAHGQGERLRRVVLLHALAENDPEVVARVAAFGQGLEALGWTENRNIRIEHRYAGGDFARIHTHTAEVVRSVPDVIVATSTAVVVRLKQATGTIPIVFFVLNDPVGQGLVASLSHPGGNITGFTFIDFPLIGKWLEMLKEVAPGVRRIAFVFNPQSTPFYPHFLREFGVAPASLAVELLPSQVRDEAEIEAVVSALAREPGGGLILAPDLYLNARRHLIMALAERLRLPSIWGYREFVREGALISYGPDTSDIARRSASYVDRILKGEKPADLPVQAPTKFELVINLRTAKALGLTVPLIMQMTADEVIE
jgi:putative tryptophan/tyrosine transport system substrate-binding protein